MPESPHKVVIVGAGFGGLFAARFLAKSRTHVTVIDKQNHHLFQPLLYQVATAALAPTDVAWPVRSVLAGQHNTSVRLGTVSSIDTDTKHVLIDDEQIPYDSLIIATGARHSYFGQQHWAEHTLGLKTLEDAIDIRQRLLLSFEKAENSIDDEQRRSLMRFIIVGAGPTGVELAGALSELARDTLAADFRNIDPGNAEIILVEAGPRVLPTFSERSSDYTYQELTQRGVDVRLNTRVTDCQSWGVKLDDSPVEAATVLWAAGVEASPAASWLGVNADRAGRVVVDQTLSVPGKPGVFVIGDTANVTNPDGTVVPGIAPAAKQQGRYVAEVINGQIESRPVSTPFCYSHAGDLATIGRNSAVSEFKRISLRGSTAWWLWGIAHVYFLIGLTRPLFICIRWMWEYTSYGRGARLITGTSSSEPRSDSVVQRQSGK